jgi:hypothetical protein
MNSPTVHKTDRQVDGDSTYVINTYNCLLADISSLSGVPLGAPNDISNDWVLIEGPKLDKQLLQWLEGTGEMPVFPEWLAPLWTTFTSTMDAEYLRYIRQLLLFCYKIETEPTNDQLQEAQKAFEDCERDVETWEAWFEANTSSNQANRDTPLFSYARQIVGRVIGRIDWSAILPGHGPGAVYPPCLPRDKSKFSTIYTTIDQHYPFAEYFCALPSFWWDHLVIGDSKLQVSDNIECRLVAVPKDSRGPRLICVHPKEAIWIQQGCRRLLERAIVSECSPCHGRINFQDQGVNGGLALKSSIDRELVTLDLKEASDRVSCKLVEHLFGAYTYGKLSCSRASSVRLLDERVIPLRKWAPMGNALTFPVQSLIFYSLVRSGIRCRYGVNCNDVYVFGDDILFPRKFWDGAVMGLVRGGLVPNMNKTFRHGFFRESCGVDAFKGKDVTPHRLRRLDTSTGSGAMSVCTLAKAMGKDGYRQTSDYLYRLVQKAWGPLPLSNNPNAQGLHRYEECDLGKLLSYEATTRFNRRLHKWQTRVLLVGGMQEHVPNGSWWNLQDSILKLHRKNDDILEDQRPLEYAVPHRTRLKRGWTDVAFKS